MPYRIVKKLKPAQDYISSLESVEFGDSEKTIKKLMAVFRSYDDDPEKQKFMMEWLEKKTVEIFNQL